MHRHPAESLTLGTVAAEAGCAKGLIHYHFKTKSALLAQAAARLWEDRIEPWRVALDQATPTAAIDAGWRRLLEESTDGTVRACVLVTGSADKLVAESAREAAATFRTAVTDAVRQMLTRMHRTPTVPAGELGPFVSAVVTGLGLDAADHGDAAALEGSWAAFWIALLSLTRPV